MPPFNLRRRKIIGCKASYSYLFPFYFFLSLLLLVPILGSNVGHGRRESNGELETDLSGPWEGLLFDRRVRSSPSSNLRVGRPRKGRILTGPAMKKRVRTINLKTSLGIAVGTIDTSKSRSQNSNEGLRPFHSFRGIPYAGPPIGSLRWTDPVDRTDPWESGRLDATRFRSSCPQWNADEKIVIGNEDCLYLNVFTPFLPGSPLDAGLPVLVFIHGGAYVRGASSSYGPDRLMRENIVVVTLNYRLGILGFLSSGDTSIPGNYGALDQVSALRWVSRHIKEFGGDPTAITLGGFSAGASLAHLHMMSPLSKGLFHRVIMMSGAGNCLWSVQDDPWEVAGELASDLDCTTSSSDRLKECLLLKDTETLIKAQTKRERFGGWPFAYRPVVDALMRDDPFLPACTRELEANPLPSPVPVLLGTTPDEGILFSLRILFSEENSTLPKIFDDSATYIFESLWPNKTTAKEISSSLADLYFSQRAREDMNTFIAEMTEATTDLFFTSCVWRAAQNLAERGLPVYTYLMAHHDPGSPSFAAPLFRHASAMGVSSPLMSNGVSHGDDVMLLFSPPFTRKGMSTRDRVMSQILARFWANFVRKGSPQIEELLSQGTPSWDPIEPGKSLCYYRLSLSPSVVDRPYRHKEQNFWRQTIPRVEELAIEASLSYTWEVATWLLLTLVLLLILLLICIAILIYRKGRTKEYSKGLPTLKTQISRLASFRRESS